MTTANKDSAKVEPPKDELKEKLAAIEHERWADWQKWCHQVLRQELPVEVIPFLNDMVLARWERQIDTPYEALSDKEKASDMEQVDRYWPLIEGYIKLQQEALLDQAIATELPWPKDVFGEVPSDDWSDIDDWLRENKGYAIDTVSATLMRRGWKCYLRELNKLRLEL